MRHFAKTPLGKGRELTSRQPSKQTGLKHTGLTPGKEENKEGKDEERLPGKQAANRETEQAESQKGTKGGGKEEKKQKPETRTREDKNKKHKERRGGRRKVPRQGSRQDSTAQQKRKQARKRGKLNEEGEEESKGKTKEKEETGSDKKPVRHRGQHRHTHIKKLIGTKNGLRRSGRTVKETRRQKITVNMPIGHEKNTEPGNGGGITKDGSISGLPDMPDSPPSENFPNVDSGGGAIPGAKKNFFPRKGLSMPARKKSGARDPYGTDNRAREKEMIDSLEM